MKTNSTKSKLISSLLILTLCVTMFVGSTYAWFTDSVTSTGNQIVSGTLDVDLVNANGDSLAGGNIKWAAKDGRSDILWEPGCTYQTEQIFVENKGSLALKYDIAINGITGSAELLNVIEWSVLMDNQEIDLDTFVGKLNKGEKSKAIVIQGHMKETAGNEYQGKTLDAFSITVEAYQLNSEADSFGPDYDIIVPNVEWYVEAGADATEYVIDTADELAGLAAIVNGTAVKPSQASTVAAGTASTTVTATEPIPADTFEGQTIKLGADIDLMNKNWTPIGRIGTTSTDFTYAFRGTFDGDNHTVKNLKVSNDGWAGLFGIAYKADIKNVKIDTAVIKSNRMAGAVVGQLYGSIDNCDVTGANITVVPNWTGTKYDNGDKVGGVVGWIGDNGNNRTLKNCNVSGVTIKAYRDAGGVAGYVASSTTLDNNKADNVKITIDQITNYYGDKDANAGSIYGRTGGAITFNSNNTANDAFAKEVLTGASDAADVSASLVEGEDVTLVADVTVTETMTVPAGKDVTIDLNGHDLSYAVSNSGASAIINNEGDLNITGEGTISFVAANPDLGAIPAYATNTITNTGTLVIGEGVTVTNGSDGGASYAVDNHGVFTLDGGTLIGNRCALRIARYNQDDVQFTMNSGTVTAKTPAWIQLPGSDSAAVPKITVKINGGTFQSTNATSADNNVLYTYSYGNSHANTSITITGGEFLGGTVSIGSGYKGDAPTLTITGGTFEYDVLQWNADDTSTVLYAANK